MKVLVSVFLLITFLTGCVGLGPVTTKVSTTKLPHKYEHCLSPKQIGELSYCAKPSPSELSVENIVRLWGEPEDKKEQDGLIIYTYDGGVAWRGMLGIFVFIPIPILFPVGTNDILLTFKNDVLLKIEIESGSADGNMLVCGMHSTGPNGFGCRTGW